MNTRLSELMTLGVVTVSPTTSMESCTALMEERRISSLVVNDNGLPVGIITERDVLGALSCQIALDTPVERVMGKPLVTARGEDDYCEAVRMFARHSIRHVVIVDAAGKLAGIVSETDLCRKGNLIGLVGECSIDSAVDQNPVLLPRDTAIAAAAMWMGRGRQSSVFVVDGARPVGILTERDMVKQYREGRGGEEIDGIVSTPVATIRSGSLMIEAIEQMRSLSIRHLAVVDGKGDIVAQLSENDILRTAGATGGCA